MSMFNGAGQRARASARTKGENTYFKTMELGNACLFIFWIDTHIFGVGAGGAKCDAVSWHEFMEMLMVHRRWECEGKLITLAFFVFSLGGRSQRHQTEFVRTCGPACGYTLFACTTLNWINGTIFKWNFTHLKRLTCKLVPLPHRARASNRICIQFKTTTATSSRWEWSWQLRRRRKQQWSSFSKKKKN